MKGEGIKQETDRVYVGMVLLHILSSYPYIDRERGVIFWREKRFDYIHSIQHTITPVDITTLSFIPGAVSQKDFSNVQAPSRYFANILAFATAPHLL